MTIVEFITARLDEAEAHVHAEGGYCVSGNQMCAREPRRLLADIRTKRGIVRVVQDEIGEEWSGDPRRDGVLVMLASIYSDHPDFKVEWVE